MAKLFDEHFWDERYGSSSTVWSGQPNPQLVAELSDLEPVFHASLRSHHHPGGRPEGSATHGPATARTALDVGCGEGADAVWLSGRGWDVTAVDISRVALQRAEAHAAGLNLAGTVSWEHHDLLRWIPPTAAFDVVSAQFMHLPTQDREPLYSRLAEAVAPGGTLLIVGHSAQDIQAGARRPQGAELYFTAAELAQSLDPELWRVDRAEARPRTAVDPEGRQITIHDEVLRATRLR